MHNTSILVVDDDPETLSLLRTCLAAEGARVSEAKDAEAALEVIARGGINLIALDQGLGAYDGFDLEKRIRKITTTPIIMLTSNDDVIDRVVGLELGADDCITKPFHAREVVARVKAVLRRTKIIDGAAACACDPPCSCGNGPRGDALYFDGIKACPERFELIDREGKRADLTSGDFKLLNIFLTRPKRVLSRDQMMDLTGGIGWTPLDRTIDNQVARLRKKIERNPSDPQLIKTVRGIGYSFACDVTAEPSDAATNKASISAL